MKKYILTAIMTLLLFGQAFFFGVNDVFIVFFIFFTAALLYLTIIRLQSSARKMWRPFSKEGGLLHQFLTRETTFWMHITAIFSSFILSAILVVLIKGMVLQQGYLAFFTVIVISSLFIYSFVNMKIHSEIAEKNIHDDVTQHGNELARIFYAAFVLNLILSFSFSAYDTFEFKTSDINFNNFDDKVIADSIKKTETNEYGRIFINAYLVMDYVKIALAKMFVDRFNLGDNFYGFYLVIFVLNGFKLFAFSFAFVVLQRGFDSAATALVPVVINTRSKLFFWAKIAANKLILVANKIVENIKKRKAGA